MKVKELIELLKKVNPEHEVIMASDSEGNNFSPLWGWGEAMYIPQNFRYGYIANPDDLEEEGKPYINNSVVIFPS